MTTATATATQDLTGTYYPAEAGATGWRDARELRIDGQRVSAVINGRDAALFIGGTIVFEGELPADVVGGEQVNIWARDLALTPAQEPTAEQFPGSYGAKHELAAQIAERGVLREYPALFGLDGNLVPAKEVETRFGHTWMLLDGAGRYAGWFNESKAQRDTTRIRNNAKKGYYVGTVLVPCYADRASGNFATRMPVARRMDDGFSTDVIIVDNGQKALQALTA